MAVLNETIGNKNWCRSPKKTHQAPLSKKRLQKQKNLVEPLGEGPVPPCWISMEIAVVETSPNGYLQSFRLTFWLIPATKAIGSGPQELNVSKLKNTKILHSNAFHFFPSYAWKAAEPVGSKWASSALAPCYLQISWNNLFSIKPSRWTSHITHVTIHCLGPIDSFVDYPEKSKYWQDTRQSDEITEEVQIAIASFCSLLIPCTTHAQFHREKASIENVVALSMSTKIPSQKGKTSKDTSSTSSVEVGFCCMVGVSRLFRERGWGPDAGLRSSCAYINFRISCKLQVFVTFSLLCPFLFVS